MRPTHWPDVAPPKPGFDWGLVLAAVAAAVAMIGGCVILWDAMP